MTDLRKEFEVFYENKTGKKPLTWNDALAIAKMPQDAAIGDDFFVKHTVDCFEAFKAGFAAAMKG